jgi:hypothetical protein
VDTLEKTIEETAAYLKLLRQNLDFCANEMNCVLRDLNQVKSQLDFNRNRPWQQSSIIFNKIEALSASLNEIHSFIVSP